MRERAAERHVELAACPLDDLVDGADRHRLEVAGAEGASGRDELDDGGGLVLGQDDVFDRAVRQQPTLFRRDKKRDFASGSGEVLLASKVRQALLTEGATPRSSGELPWRTSLGVGLILLRHQKSDATLKELARVYVRDALKRWVPGARLVSLEVEQDGAKLTLRIRVREGATEATATLAIFR